MCLSWGVESTLGLEIITQIDIYPSSVCPSVNHLFTYLSMPFGLYCLKSFTQIKEALIPSLQVAHSLMETGSSLSFANPISTDF